MQASKRLANSKQASLEVSARMARLVSLLLFVLCCGETSLIIQFEVVSYYPYLATLADDCIFLSDQ